LRNPGAILIVGRDSLIGRSLLLRLREAGQTVIGTTRRPESSSPPDMMLDLAGDPASWQCPESVNVAVLCAGVTKIAGCRANPEDSARINVDALVALAERLASRGTFVVYLSTNHVFDGTRPFVRADDPISPATEYGRQKAEAEGRIRALDRLAAIVRFTKVLGSGDPLFSQWSVALKNSQVIHPFSDMFMAPVPVACAVTVLCLVALTRQPGIWQVSGDRDISYAEAARLGAASLRVSDALVQPIPMAQAISGAGQPPRNTTLDIERIRTELGIEPPRVTWSVSKAFINPSTLERSY
jgi:dTDP-4-dehydrorhamnose reductase